MGSRNTGDTMAAPESRISDRFVFIVVKSMAGSAPAVAGMNTKSENFGDLEAEVVAFVVVVVDRLVADVDRDEQVDGAGSDIQAACRRSRARCPPAPFTKFVLAPRRTEPISVSIVGSKIVLPLSFHTEIFCTSP